MGTRVPPVRRCLVILLVVSVVVAGIIPMLSTTVVGQDDDDKPDCDAERLFYSDDDDSTERTDTNLTNISEIQKAKKNYSPGEFACVADVAIQTTNSKITVEKDGSILPLSLQQLQEGKTREYDRNQSTSALFAQTGSTSQKGIIQEAHITLLGVVGGGKPAFGEGSGEKPIYLSKSGTVLNFADYRINESAMPNVCGPKKYNVTIESYAGGSSAGQNGSAGNGTNQTANISSSTVQVVEDVSSDDTVDISVNGEQATFEVKESRNNSSTGNLSTLEEAVSGRALTDPIENGEPVTPGASSSITITNISQSCSYTTFTSRDINRTMSIAGESKKKTGGFAVSKNPLTVEKTSGDKDHRSFEYDVSTGGNSSLNLSATFQATAFETTIERNWNAGGENASSESNGSWGLNIGMTEKTQTDRLTVKSNHSVVFTDVENPGITQKVIHVSENEQYVVMDFPGDHGNSSLTSSADTNGSGAPVSVLNNRPIWTNMSSESGFELRGPWNVFSMRPSGQFATYGLGGIQSGGSSYGLGSVQSGGSSRFPQVPVARIYADRRRPTVVSQDDSSSGTFSQVIGWQGRNISTSMGSLPRGVDLYAPKPVVMDKIVVKNVPGGFQELETVHGETVSLEDGIEEIPYREPVMNLSKDGDQVRVQLRDPKTNESIEGREISLQGTENSTLVTDENGVVTSNRTSVFVRAKFSGDDWQDVGDVFYGSVTERASFNPIEVIISRLATLIIVSVGVAPLFITYFWWRGVRRDNQHLWQ